MYWNPEQYLQFEKERTQPAIDLANRIPQKAVDRVLDVGCGPGNSTKVLAERLPGARVLGIDRSLEMIEVAKEQHPALQFIQWDASQDLEGLGPSFDVIFSNACIQWIPDHPALLGRFMDRLNPGGILAVQVPMNNREPIHQIIQECYPAHDGNPFSRRRASFSSCNRRSMRLYWPVGQTNIPCGRLYIITACPHTVPFWNGIVEPGCGHTYKFCPPVRLNSWNWKFWPGWKNAIPNKKTGRFCFVFQGSSS